MMKFMNSLVIPAQPGFKIIYSGEGEDRTYADATDFDHVIAWRVDTFRVKDSGEIDEDGLVTFVMPVTPDGCVGKGEWGIMQPDGTVHDPMNQTHRNLSAYFDSMRERHTKKEPQPW